MNIDQYWTRHLRLVAERATCVRRKTGAIITDLRGAILSSGYNGIGSGVPHCGTEGSPCTGERTPGDSGNENTACWATHAEQNAILTCHRLDLAWTMYCTNFPCFNCAKSIVNTPIKRIVALEDYPGDRRGLVLLSFPKHSMTPDNVRQLRIGNTLWVRENGGILTNAFHDPLKDATEVIDSACFYLYPCKDSIL